MNNARETFNVFLGNICDGLSGGFQFYTGDEVDDSTIKPPCLVVEWIGDDRQGSKPESRIRTVQIDLRVMWPEMDTRTAEQSCEQVLKGLGFISSSNQPYSHPKTVIPKYSYSAGINSPVDTGSQLILTPFMNKFFKQVQGNEQHIRHYIMSVDVDYIPG